MKVSPMVLVAGVMAITLVSFGVGNRVGYSVARQDVAQFTANFLTGQNTTVPQWKHVLYGQENTNYEDGQ